MSMERSAFHNSLLQISPFTTKFKVDDLELNKGEQFLFTTARGPLNIGFGGRGGDQKLKLVLWSVVRRGQPLGERIIEH